MYFWMWIALVLASLVSCQEQSFQPYPVTPLRHPRAIAPSFSSWCIFYPERCRMLQAQDSGLMKRFRFF